MTTRRCFIGSLAASAGAAAFAGKTLGLPNLKVGILSDIHLSQPEKHQVFFHRRTNGVPTEDTDFFRAESQRLIAAANSGDVLVTPGISECEKRIKNRALEQRLRLIHLQAEPIGRYWKPERSRFDACAYGSLLVLAPWPEDMPAFGSDYERFHYLNRLAGAVCAIGHATEVAVQGLCLAHGDR